MFARLQRQPGLQNLGPAAQRLILGCRSLGRLLARLEQRLRLSESHAGIVGRQTHEGQQAGARHQLLRVCLNRLLARVRRSHLHPQNVGFGEHARGQLRTRHVQAIVKLALGGKGRALQRPGLEHPQVQGFDRLAQGQLRTFHLGCAGLGTLLLAGVIRRQPQQSKQWLIRGDREDVGVLPAYPEGRDRADGCVEGRIVMLVFVAQVNRRRQAARGAAGRSLPCFQARPRGLQSSVLCHGHGQRFIDRDHTRLARRCVDGRQRGKRATEKRRKPTHRSP